MPVYDYICSTCKHRFEELVKSYKDEVKCPKCGSVAERSYSGEMFSATGKPVKKCSGNCKNCDGCK